MIFGSISVSATSHKRKTICGMKQKIHFSFFSYSERLKHNPIMFGIKVHSRVSFKAFRIWGFIEIDYNGERKTWPISRCHRHLISLTVKRVKCFDYSAPIVLQVDDQASLLFQDHRVSSLNKYSDLIELSLPLNRSTYIVSEWFSNYSLRNLKKHSNLKPDLIQILIRKFLYFRFHKRNAIFRQTHVFIYDCVSTPYDQSDMLNDLRKGYWS